LFADDSVLAARSEAHNRQTHFLLHPQTSNRSHNGNASCEHQYHRLINQHHLIIRDLVARSCADPRAKAATSLSATSHNNDSHLPLPTTHTQQPFRNRTFADMHLQSRPRRTTVSLTAARANCIADIDGRQPVLTPSKSAFRAAINPSSFFCPATTHKPSRTFSLPPNILPALTRINSSTTPLGILASQRAGASASLAHF
jgi:hypothetical protein